MNIFRKAECEAQKPKLTPEQIAVKTTHRKIEHYSRLRKKTQSKIKALVTRDRTYEKRIKYHTRKLGGDENT